MKKCVVPGFIFAVLITGCLSVNKTQQNLTVPDEAEASGRSVFWLDRETGTVHKIISENGIEKVVSIIKYRHGIPLEKMKIVSSENSEGKIHWIYFVPSTKYIVELTALSFDNSGISVEWKNKSSDGDVDSGSDILIKCDEHGFINDKIPDETNETELLDDFKLFHKIQ